MSETSDFIFKIVKENRKDIISILIIATLGSLLASSVPYVYGKLFDMSTHPNSELSIVASMIFLWLSLSLISNYISNKTLSIGDLLSIKISLNSEYEAYSHFIKLPISFHKNQRRGEILQKISRSSWNLQRIVELFTQVLPQFLLLIFSLAAMLFLKWQLASVIILSFAIYTAVTIAKTKHLIKLNENEDKLYEKQYGKVYDKLYNVFLVKNFATEKREDENIRREMVERLVPVSRHTIREANKLTLIQDMIYTISFVSVLGMAILFLRMNSLTPGEFVMFFGYTNLSFAPFRHITSVYRSFKRATVSVRRLVKLKKMIPEEMKHGNHIVENFRGEISFENISFQYSKDREILKNISLKIKAGETVALVGKSGVGKTTFSELIMGYYHPQEGRIKFDGFELENLKLNWIRDQIAIVPQDLNLFNESLLNNLRYANPRATKEEIVDACKAASAHEFIMNFPRGYNSVVGEKGLKLSMGQKQRIAFAMAFLKNPKILILDEPTSALDAESERNIQEGINRLIKGRTTIIIAHRFSTVRKANRIVVLDKGKIAEIGTHDELMRKKGIYCNLYSLQKGLD